MFYKEFQLVLEFFKKRILSTTLVILILVSSLFYIHNQDLRKQDMLKVAQVLKEDQELLDSYFRELKGLSDKEGNEQDYKIIKTKINSIQEGLLNRSNNFPLVKRNDEIIKIEQNRVKYLTFLASHSFEFYLQSYNWHLENHQKLIKTNSLANIKENSEKQEILDLVDLFLRLIQDYEEKIINLDLDKSLKIKHLTRYDKTKNKLLSLKKYLQETTENSLTKENYRFISKEIFKDDLNQYFNYRFLKFDLDLIYTPSLLDLESKLLFYSISDKK